MSLRLRLTLSYVLVAVLCLLLVTVLANVVLESTFRSYARETTEKRARNLALQLGAQLRADGSWDVSSVAAIGMGALEQGMIVRLTDASGAVVWDAAEHNSGLCAQMLAHMARNMESRYRSWRGSYTETALPVRASFREAGRLTVGYYGPFFFNDEDISFLGSLNRLLLWISLAGLAIAVAVGVVMARRITGPLARVAAATRRIGEGERGILIEGTTRTRELDGIAAAVNNLSRGLAEQEELRRRLTADMAHELRTPLATLQSHLEAIIDGVWVADRKRLSGLHEEILRLTRMVSDMESLERLESGAALEPRVVDVGGLVERLVGTHEPLFREGGIALSFTREEEGATTARVDPDRLSQAVVNLLSNARRYTPAGGTVRVAVDGDDESVTVSVSDTGIGISTEDQKRIFERFYRADASRSRDTGGSGIGLSIARAIIEAHGGTISVTSSEGRGSIFRIQVPRGAQAPLRASTVILTKR